MSWSPVAVRVMRPKLAGRGLSALVKGLREMEDAKLDEEMELLRQMEGGDGDAQDSQARPVSKVCVEDSQVPEMPLGPDGQGESESEDLERSKTEGTDRNGKPLKVWKKKGQKRTTRRVTIKPNTAKWKPEPEWKGAKDEESEDEVVAVEETQLITKPGAAEPDIEAEGLQTDNDYMSEAGSDEGTPRDQKTAKQVKQRGKPKEVQSEPPKEERKKKKKTVSATAHANFRALKIRDKHSKGKGRGKFGRRR